ncbi:MAG: PLDc N-terminal domain-containing protein [Actinomycetales bacterium]|nr:PLDc N-terminal domain-containing protein [Actinomycetales bacterium]
MSVVSVVSVVSIVRDRGVTAMAEAGWILVILLAPLVGALLWFLFGRTTRSSRVPVA